MKIDYTQIAIGMALGYLVLPGLLGNEIKPKPAQVSIKDKASS